MQQHIRITKEFKFEVAHSLDHYQGKCRNIHGHSYELQVTVLGIPEKTHGHNEGMVMDFTDLKSIIQEHIVKAYDHALVLFKDSPKLGGGALRDENLLLLDHQPTCENMLIDMVKRVKDRFNSGVVLHSMRLRETRTSYAEWHAADQRFSGVL